ncbi:hypothetical protein Tco_0116755 [Tanacetum coccineum]
MERFENAIFKQRAEINDRMAEIEEEKNDNDDMAVDGGINRIDTKMLVKESEKENKAERIRVGKVKGKTYNLLPRGPVYEAILRKKITRKEDIGENFEIPCNIGGLKCMNALVDQGSDINVKPLSTDMKLTDERLAETDIKLSLASHLYIYPLGIAEDVLVDVAGIPKPLCKVEKGIKNDVEPIAPTITVNRLVLEWEERIRLHQEKKMEFDQWRSKNFNNKHPALIKVEGEINEREVTSKLEYKFQDQENSEDIFSFGSALEDFICVVFVPDRNIINVDVDNFKRCCTSYTFDVGYKVLRDILLHCSSINSGVRLSNKFGGFYFSFKFGISGLLHQVITTIADRIRDKDTSQSKQNLQSSSMTFIHKTLIIPSVLDSCFNSFTVCEVKRVMILLYIKICAYDKNFSSIWTYTTMMLPRVRNHHGGKCVHSGLNLVDFDVSMSTSRGVNHYTSVSRPQLKSYQVKDKVVPNNSQVKFNHKVVEEHHRILSISRKTKSVTACNDSSKSRTLNVNADAIETINIELEHKVAKLLKENETLKRHYKEMFDSIKTTRAKNIEHTTSLIANNDKFKAQLQEKDFAIAALKNKLRKLTGNSVNTKFAKSSILGKPVLQPCRKQSVVRQPTAFKSERPRFSKQRSQSTTNGSKPTPRINNQNSRNCPASKRSCVTTKIVPRAEHSRNCRNFTDSKHFVCSTCQKCVFNANHDSCVTKFLNEVNSRAKVPSHKTTTRNKPVEQTRFAKKPERQIPKGHRFSIKKTFVVHEKTMTPRSCLRWKPTGRIFKTIGLRWVPTGKIFAFSTNKVDSEPINGSNDDITNQYEYKQTLDVSAGQKASDYDNSDPVPPRQNVVPTAEKTDSSQQGLEFLFSPLLEEYYNPAHDQAEDNNNDQAPNASF